MFELFLFGGLEMSGALPLDPLNTQHSTQFTLQAIVAITIALATVGLLTEHFRLSNMAELKAQAQKVKSAEKTAGHLALQSRLTRLEAMASVGRLASGTAHEVNNPLAYIMGNLELVIRDMSTDPLHNAESLGALQDALAGAHTIQNVVKDLSTFSRTDEELTAVDLQPVLDSACKMANNQLRHRAVLRKEYAHTPLVVGIESRIGQVFLNLLINAAQAIPPGNAQDNIITIRTYVPNNDLVCVEVSDTGDGIPAEELSLVTQPFFTTKPGDMGAGLGLAVCENILHSLGGRLEIESQENEGTKVTVHLPVATVENTDTPVIPTSLPSQWTEKSGNQPLPALRILVIDDNTLVTRVLQRALMDHDVMIRNDGRLALEELHAAAHFDLILCDLMMPNVTGFNLFEHVRTTCPHLLSSFVFITGGAFTQGAQEFVQSTSALILHKPINLNALRALIEQRCQIKHIQETLSTAH